MSMESGEKKIEWISKHIRDILPTIMGEPFNIEQVGNDDDLMLFGLDSMGAIRLMVEIENCFEIEIPDDDVDIDNFNTISKICDYVSELVTICPQEHA